MIPRYDVSIDSTVPVNAAYWAPPSGQPDDDQTIGDFHDTELIETDLVEARMIIEAEQQALSYLDSNASTAREFDDLAADIEFEMPDVPSDDAPSFLHETSWYGVNGLEIGVAGLVYMLNAVGVVTAASCRSHHQSFTPWSEHPVVIFAANEATVARLQPLVDAAGCGFEIDVVNRPRLIGIAAPSVLELGALAQAILRYSEEFAATA